VFYLNAMTYSVANNRVEAVKTLLDWGVCPLVSPRGVPYGAPINILFNAHKVPAKNVDKDEMCAAMLSRCTEVDLNGGFVEINGIRVSLTKDRCGSYLWLAVENNYPQTVELILTKHSKYINPQREVLDHDDKLFMYVFTNCSFEACKALVDIGAFTPDRRFYLHYSDEFFNLPDGHPNALTVDARKALRTQVFTNVLNLPRDHPNAPKKLSRDLDSDGVSEINKVKNMVRETRRVRELLTRTKYWANESNALMDVAGRKWTPRWHTLPLAVLGLIRRHMFPSTYHANCIPRSPGFFEQVNVRRLCRTETAAESI
jgi:hypothetical protein